jgi:hypothetical protein
MRVPRTLLASIVAASMIACGGASDDEIARAKVIMDQICRYEAGYHVYDADLKLAEIHEPHEPLPDSIAIVVGKDGVVVDGDSVATAADLAAEDRILRPIWDGIRARHPRTHEAPPKKPVVLALDSATPAREVRVVLNTLLQFGVREVLLVFETDIASQLPVAPDRQLDDELRRLPEGQRPLYGANKMAEQAADCPPLAERIDAMSYMPPGERCAFISDSLSEVFGSFSCKADIDKVVTLFHAMSVPARPIAFHRVVLHTDAPGIPTRPGDTWARIAEALFERGGDRLWIELPAASAPAPEPAPAPR